MTTVKVVWQRLVDEKGDTCDRCNKTYLNLEKVINVLKPALKQLGIELKFEKRAISLEAFEKNPLSSNEILIDGNPLEKVLGLKVGQSPCCGPCGDNECRTLIDDTGEKEEVEERVFLKALLKTLAEKL
jgi:hypothetical protein